MRPFVERLITLAKRGLADPAKALHARRLCLERLHDKDTIKLLFNEVAPRYMNRAGGYTRIIKRHERRLGDAGETAFLELLKEGETKVRFREKGEAPAPAPAPIPETHLVPESAAAPTATETSAPAPT